MRCCRQCRRLILDDGSEQRKQWCRSIRRLLKIGAVQPENYHRDCFMDALLADPVLSRPATQPSSTPARVRVGTMGNAHGGNAPHVRVACA